MNEFSSIEAYFLFDNKIREKYIELQTKHLKEYDLTAIFIEAIRDKAVANNFDYSEFKLLDEIDYLSQEIKYQSAILHILNPRINNPEKEQDTYIQTIEDHRYLMYANWSLQTIYNYWDRLGDLLWHVFSTKLKAKEVYFDRVMTAIPIDYKSTESYTKLLEHFETKVKPLLQERNRTVHYFSLETHYRWGHIKNRDSLLNKEMFVMKSSLAEVITNQLEECILGFKLAIDLIMELPSKSNSY